MGKSEDIFDIFLEERKSYAVVCTTNRCTNETKRLQRV